MRPSCCQQGDNDSTPPDPTRPPASPPSCERRVRARTRAPDSRCATPAACGDGRQATGGATTLRQQLRLARCATQVVVVVAAAAASAAQLGFRLPLFCFFFVLCVCVRACVCALNETKTPMPQKSFGGLGACVVGQNNVLLHMFRSAVCAACFWLLLLIVSGSPATHNRLFRRPDAGSSTSVWFKMKPTAEIVAAERIFRTCACNMRPSPRAGASSTSGATFQPTTRLACFTTVALLRAPVAIRLAVARRSTSPHPHTPTQTHEIFPAMTQLHTLWASRAGPHVNRRRRTRVVDPGTVGARNSLAVRIAILVLGVRILE